MKRTNPNEHLPAAERLNLVLSVVEQPLRDELHVAFGLMNPLQFAAKLHSLELSNYVKRQLLLTKVSQPPPYKGPSLESLMEKAMVDFWKRLVESHAEAKATNSTQVCLPAKESV